MSGEAPFKNFGTDAIHAGQEPEKWDSRSVVPLIGLSTTFKQVSPGVLRHDRYEYSRGGNPTRECLEECVAKLENGKHALAYASGLAATMSMVEALLENGDHAVTGDDLYGGTNRYFNKVASKHGVEFTMVDVRNPDNVVAAIKPNTKMVWFELMSNPLLRVGDVKTIAEKVHAVNKDIVVCVDNTFLTCYNSRPLDLGADVVMHSATKYMNGHSDVVMGLLAMKSDELKKKLMFAQFAIGAVPSPFDCYLVNRGLKTLHVRMQRHGENGLAVAKFLESHDRVAGVSYPGLPSHPQHEVFKTVARGCSGMVVFYIKGGLEQAKTFLASLKVFTLAESLGGFESLAEHPAIMTHASVPEDQREVLGISDTFIRLSVGLEDEADLLADLDQALKAALPTV
ncbi:Oidioi.mRNA.OKI2018_I69.chrUn_1.g17208.t1.cds [Oikopleura dioica]|uniref:Cystathionine gamma-lyase n=1 Tax=Oikopleura dioica TaxID=34765 RepID=A0ABN7TDN5_OIKDI|nr:Oidioi.mRNA.OKI2018_I69.chrUn_1.g17208.t1.cds [Oikopleura dioica]